MADNIVTSQIGKKPIKQIKQDIYTKAYGDKKKSGSSSTTQSGSTSSSDSFYSLKTKTSSTKTKAITTTKTGQTAGPTKKESPITKETVVSELQDNNLNLIA